MEINRLIKLFFEETYLVPKSKKKKVKDFNPKTNRMKKFKRTDYHKTTIPPEERTFKNKPDNVRFQDWLGIKGQKTSPHHSVNSFGKSEYDGKWYGWSHRAVTGFKVGDTVNPDTCGNIRPGKKWIIKTEEQAKEQAKAFADVVS